MHFISALTLLVGRQERHTACKRSSTCSSQGFLRKPAGDQAEPGENTSVERKAESASLVVLVLRARITAGDAGDFPGAGRMYPRQCCW